MAKTNFQTIDEYHKTFPKDIQERLQAIRQLVHKVAPKAEEAISYQIPAFKLAPKYFLIYYCAFAKHCTISSVWSPAFLKEFEKELKDYKVSKSAIQLPNDKPLPMALVKRMLEFRMKEFEKLKKS